MKKNEFMLFLWCSGLKSNTKEKAYNRSTRLNAHLKSDFLERNSNGIGPKNVTKNEFMKR